jgi:uncharacterized protein YdeI (YjbR/CyaY-like superfamily)
MTPFDLVAAPAARWDRPAMKPIFFPTPAHLRAWLAASHDKAGEVLVGFHKVGTGKPSITWPQSVDQALCFGWIDGVRRALVRRKAAGAPARRR